MMPAMSNIYLEISQQPSSLRQLVKHRQQQGVNEFKDIPCPPLPVLTGMGASLNAAMIAAFHLQRFGVPAIVLPASNLLHYGQAFLNNKFDLIYISQSGSSAEVVAFLKKYPSKKIYLGITNDAQSPLAAACRFLLPLFVDNELLVASKTYLNSLATLWILARAWTRNLAGDELEQLLRLADWIGAIFRKAELISDYWMQELESCASVTFTGYGPHGATALQSAQTLSEWVKIPSLGIDAASLRHGFIEIADAHTGFVVFASQGRTQSLARRLASELRGYGSKVILVEDGQTVGLKLSGTLIRGQDEFLVPIQDVIPVQLYTEKLARKRGVTPRFRHLNKVVKYL